MLLITYFNSNWSCVRRAVRKRDLHYIGPMFLNTSYRTHSLSSTAGGTTGPKWPRIPPVKQQSLHAYLFMLSSMHLSILGRGQSLTWGDRGRADRLSGVVQLDVDFHSFVPPSGCWFPHLCRRIFASVNL